MVPQSGVGTKAVDYEVEQQDGGRVVKRKEAGLTRGSHGGVPVATSSVGRDMLAVSDIQAETPYAQLNAASVPGEAGRQGRWGSLPTARTLCRPCLLAADLSDELALTPIHQLRRLTSCT
uniref:Uncharacterized protein n=2 Tax=Oryza TaxID=4527 RepID=A0A0D3FBU9_9ORYZ